MTSAKTSCSVCLEPVDEQHEAFCGNCGETYHLNQRNDLPGKDCGEVWINDEFMTLEFACNNCLHPAEGSLDDVLDLAEAAALAETSEAMLTAAAEAGAIAFRKTSSGVYLFERRAVLAYLQGRR